MCIRDRIVPDDMTASELNEIVDKFVFANKDKDPTFFWGTKEKRGSVCLKIKKDKLIAKSIT